MAPLGAGAVQRAGEGLTPSSFPRKALASGVSVPLAAADTAGPLSRVLALHRSSVVGRDLRGSGVDPLGPVPSSISSSAVPARGLAGLQSCPRRDSLCWPRPPALGRLVSGQVQPWHQVSPPCGCAGREGPAAAAAAQGLGVFVSGSEHTVPLGRPAASPGLPSALGAGQEGRAPSKTALGCVKAAWIYG